MTSRTSKRKPGPEVEIRLTIECSDGSTASALSETLMPDNRYFPKDQEFLSAVEGPLVRCDVRSPRLRPAAGTIASIISDAKLFGQLWVEAKTRGLGSAAQQ